jgi:hypothetical protein
VVARLRHRAAPAARAWRRVRFEARAARAVRSGRPVAIVLGNCQAPPVNDLLAASATFAREYAQVPVPPIHDITPAEVETLRRLLPRTELILSQPIANDYRDLGLGTEQLVTHAPPGARTIRWPSLYWPALFPYCVYVRTSPGVHVDAPITQYHDVRFLACAAAGMDGAAARALLRDHVPPRAGLAALTEDTLEVYGRLDHYCDVAVVDWIQRPEHEATAFWTINHPARSLLEEVVRQIHELLGLAYVPAADRSEPLGAIVAPIDAVLLDGRPGAARPDWVVDGRRIPQEELLDTHLAWYATRPDLVAAGAAEHARRRTLLELP